MVATTSKPARAPGFFSLPVLGTAITPLTLALSWMLYPTGWTERNRLLKEFGGCGPARGSRREGLNLSFFYVVPSRLRAFSKKIQSDTLFEGGSRDAAAPGHGFALGRIPAASLGRRATLF
jgi:hypothetical protein